MRRVIERGFAGLAVFTLLAAPATALARDSMAIQPDGRIVVAGEAWPGFAALVRLNANGSLDRSFGKRGVAIDRRLPSLRAVAVQPDGRILAASGRQLGRYLADGSLDPSFGDGGVAGETSPIRYGNRYGAEGPESLLVRPDGQFFTSGIRGPSHWLPQGIVRLYDSKGSFVETAGSVPESGPSGISWVALRDIALEGDGSVVGAGSAYSSEKGGAALLAKFLPGSGTMYDESFGGGKGLVLAAPPPESSLTSEAAADAITQDAGRLVVSGTADGTFLLARFDQAGNLDSSFGLGGFAHPPIEGTSHQFGSSRAHAIAVQEDGRLLVAGGTTKWGDWSYSPKAGASCDECPQPLVARFTANGALDPSFGTAGFVLQTTPDGKPLVGEVEQIASLADGKIIIEGSRGARYSTFDFPDLPFDVPFLARLNADGTLDRSFGDRGLVTLRPSCLQMSLTRLRRQGCIPTARVKFHVGGSNAHPTISLRVQPSLPWARIAMVRLQLPPALQVTLGAPSRTRVLAIGGTKGFSLSGGPNRYLRAEPVEPKPGRVAFRQLGEPRVLDVRLRRGALRATGLPAGNKLVFRVTVRFLHEGVRAGRQTRIFRVR